MISISTSDTKVMPFDLTKVEQSVRDAHASGALTQVLTGPPAAGFRTGNRIYHVNYGMRCTGPPEVELSGLMPGYGIASDHRTATDANHRTSDDSHLKVVYRVPCRRCIACLRQRAWHWRVSAETEITRGFARGARTWFGTLTLSPQSHFEMQLRAERSAGKLLDGLPPEEQFRLRHTAVNRELTLSFKRLRKRMKIAEAFRYMLVVERHKSGLPHYHCLLHEVSQDKPIRKSVLEAFWPWGFGQWRLVDSADQIRAARYVAKYLSKSSEARVRASLQYGRWGEEGHAPTLAALALSTSAAPGESGAACVTIRPPNDTQGGAEEVYHEHQ